MRTHGKKASFPLTIPVPTSGNEISKEPELLPHAFSPGARCKPLFRGLHPERKEYLRLFPRECPHVEYEEVMQNAARKLEVARKILRLLLWHVSL